MASLVSSEQINEFREQGVTVLRGVFSDWVDVLRRGVDANMADPDPNARIYTGKDGGGRFFVDYCNWARIPEYREFIFGSDAAAIGAELMDSKKVQLFHEHVLVKEPGTDKPTPWHHDQPYYCVNGNKVCSFWIPLDPVPKETCPEFIAGSHQWGQWFTPKKFVGVDYENDDPSLVSMPDIDQNRDDYEIRSWELEPGDAIVFHFLTVHGAPPNLSTKFRRRGFAARWLGDDTTYATRSGIISPPFPGLEEKLNEGDPMDVEEFPVVWKN